MFLLISQIYLEQKSQHSYKRSGQTNIGKCKQAEHKVLYNITSEQTFDLFDHCDL